MNIVRTHGSLIWHQSITCSKEFDVLIILLHHAYILLVQILDFSDRHRSGFQKFAEQVLKNTPSSLASIPNEETDLRKFRNEIGRQILDKSGKEIYIELDTWKQ